MHPYDEVKFTRKELEDYDEYRRARDVLTEDAPPESEFKDRQFETALERVRAMLNGEGKNGETEKNDDAKATEKDKAAA